MSATMLLLAMTLTTADAKYVEVELKPGGDRQTVLSDDLDGDGHDELVLLGGRDVSIFFLADGVIPSAPQVTVRLDDDVVFIDLGDVDGDDARELVTLSPSGVRAISFSGRRAGAPTDVAGLEVERIALHAVPALDVGWNDILVEIDGAGGEDAVLPTDDGYRVLLRTDDGFRPAGLVPALPSGTIELSKGSDLGVVEQTVVMPRLYFGDVDGDGAAEALTFDGRTVRAYARPEAGGPDALWPRRLAKTLYTVDSTLAEDLFASRNVRLEDLDATGRSLLMVVRSLDGRLDIFAGAGGDDPFTERRSLRLDGWILPPKLIDLDGDARVDLLLPTVDAIDLLQLMKIFLSRTFRMRYSIFMNREGVRYRRTPDVVRELVLPLEYQTSGGDMQVENQMVYSFDGDFDGDGRKDFLTRPTPTELFIHRGTTGEDGATFDEKPTWTRRIADSKDFLTIRPRLCDLNADGKTDLLLLYDARTGGADRYILHLSR